MTGRLVHWWHRCPLHLCPAGGGAAHVLHLFSNGFRERIHHSKQTQVLRSHVKRVSPIFGSPILQRENLEYSCPQSQEITRHVPRPFQVLMLETRDSQGPWTQAHVLAGVMPVGSRLVGGPVSAHFSGGHREARHSPPWMDSEVEWKVSLSWGGLSTTLSFPQKAFFPPQSITPFHTQKKRQGKSSSSLLGSDRREPLFILMGRTLD